jgi:hypothetical protein
MVTRRINKNHLLLLVGDMVALALVTAVGFASHGTLETAGTRLLTTYIPLAIAWLMVAPFLGAFDLRRTADPRQLWRPFWAMVLASPMAAWIRSAWLNAPILPLFVVILGGVSAIGLLIWRVLFLFALRRKG